MATEGQQGKHRRTLPAIVAAGAAAAAGYYFYGSKNAKRNRQKAAKWAREFKGDVSRGVQKLQHVDREAVVALVDAAAASYERARSIRREDIATASDELRRHWQRLVSESRTRARKRRAAKPRKRSARRGS